MIIWSRWGFLSFLAFGASVGIALALVNLFNFSNAGTHVGAMVFTCAALMNLALARWAYPRLDKPRQVTITRPLQAPFAGPYGTIQTHEIVPALDPEGNPLWVYPRSTLFFIPAKYLWIILTGWALIMWVLTLMKTMST